MTSLEGKVAIITGGGMGIGQATAQLFAERGASVVVADVNEEAGRETVDRIGGKSIFVKADITSQADVQNMVGAALQSFGAIHVLHNNAAIIRRHDTIDDIPVEEFRRVIDVNLNSLFIASRSVAPIMRKQGGGVIVNMSSLGGTVPVPYALAYAAAKAGVLGLTRTLAVLLKADGIRVNAICPGLVNTPMVNEPAAAGRRPEQPGGMMDPIDIARAVEYLVEHDELNGVFIAVNQTPQGPRLAVVKEHEQEPIDGGTG